MARLETAVRRHNGATPCERLESHAQTLCWSGSPAALTYDVRPFGVGQHQLINVSLLRLISGYDISGDGLILTLLSYFNAFGALL